MATINMLEETANYLLNHCFVLGLSLIHILPMVDIGVGQLAMHSAMETAS